MVTVETVLSDALAADLDRLVSHEPIVRAGTDTEGVHQARVAVRRLRTELAAFAPVLRPSPARTLLTEAKWLGRLLGDVRDLDVLAERISSSSVLSPAQAAPLLALLARQREPLNTSLLEGFDSGRYGRLVRSLRRAAADPPVIPAAAEADPARWLLPQVVESLAEMESVAAALSIAPRARDLHELRIRARAARYAASVAAAFGPPALGRLAKRLSRVQTVLGDLNDADRALSWLQRAEKAEWSSVCSSDVDDETVGADAAEPEPDGAASDPLIAVACLSAEAHQAVAAARTAWTEPYERAARLGRKVAAECAQLTR